MRGDVNTDALPDGVTMIKLSPGAMAIAHEILQVVKTSPISVTQLEQEARDVSEAVMNGVVNAKDLSLADHYEAVQRFPMLDSKNRALYMHNKSLIEVAGADLVHRLYKAVHPLQQDVLVDYPLLYISDNPKSSNDVLVGSKGSWSPVHQDLPLYCTSAILVLEGHKEFVVLDDAVVPSLRVNLASGNWDQPITHQGHTYPNLRSLVEATGGAVLQLRAGDLMAMPPRVFHLARNCAATVSCNFSICTMESVPLTMAQTLARIEESPRDVMHFDRDMTRLLEDCTAMLVQQAAQVRTAGNLGALTNRKRLPPVRAVLDSSVRLNEWYTLLQCIPRDWVVGFWGDVRDRLLDRLLGALPLHNRTGAQHQQQAAAGTVGGPAAADKCPAATAAQQQPAAASLVVPPHAVAAGPHSGAAAAPIIDVAAAVPRPLSLPRMVRHKPPKGPQWQQAPQGHHHHHQQPRHGPAAEPTALTTRSGAGWETLRRSTRSGRAVMVAAAAAAAAAEAAAAAAEAAAVSCSGGVDAAVEGAPPRKRAKAGGQQGGQDATGPSSS